MSAPELIDPNSSLWAWLAHDLRLYRERNGLSLAEMGRVIGAARSTVSNCEAARRRIDDAQARLLDHHFDTGGHFLRLLTFARLNHDPDWFRQRVQYEARATALRIYEALVLPDLLQIPDYARAVFTAGRERDVEAHVQGRITRQEILERRDPPLVWVVLDESVLTRPVGGPKVMAAQLARLLELTEQPHVTIRVVATSAGAYLGLDGAFTIMTVPEGEVAYTEGAGGGRLAVETSQTRAFGLRYERIGADALSREASRSLIERAMDAMR